MPQSFSQNKPRLVKACSIWRALEVVGDVPILLILESLWMGFSRFSELQEQTGLLKALLSNRLKRMVEKQILVRRRVHNTHNKIEYALTEKGIDLFYTTLMLYRWERRWGTSERRRNLRLKHDKCGAILEPETICTNCAKIFEITDTKWVEAEGTGWMPATYQRRRNQTSFDTQKPSLLKGSVELLGDRWSALVMRAIFTGKRRFDDILIDAGVPPNTLSDRLKKMMTSDVLKSQPYQDRPVRLEYTLTQKGIEYYNVIMMLMIWGDKYYASAGGPPVNLVHKTCGANLVPYVICGSCGDKVTPQDVSISDG